MRKALTISALILALSCPVYAGNMPNGDSSPPPTTSGTEPTGGDIPNMPPGDISNDDTMNGHIPNMGPAAMTDITLSLLQGVLSLL